MRKIALTLAILGTTLLAAFYTAPAQAQATRTWVSGVGDDANPCSRTAPCKTFAGAISKTATGGEINCLDPGGFGAVTITKSITLDCHEIYGSVLVSGTNGVIINGTNIVVTIRNLNFDGVGTGIDGINIQNAATVFIEDVMVMNFTSSGIEDNRTTGGKLFIRNTISRNNTVAGFVTASAAVLENVHSVGNGFGLAAHSGSNVMLNRAIISGNTTSGIQANTGSQVFADFAKVSSNGTNGVFVNGGAVTLADSDIAFNGTGINGTTSSFGNNRIFGNTSPGTTPSLIGGATNDHGQQ